MESTTLTVNVDVPCAVGVPEITTEFVVLEPSVSPLGSAPEATDHVNGAAPPDAATVALYALVMLAGGRDVVVTDGLAGFELAGVPEQPANVKQQTEKKAIRTEKTMRLAI